MNVEILDKKENILLSRTEINGSVGFEGATPSKADLGKKLAEILKIDGKLIVIKNLETHYGSTKADFLAYSYLNEEDMKKIEPEAKNGKEKKEQKEDKPKA